MTTPFAVIVRAALDEVDDLPGNEYWTIRDANRLAESILVHLTAYSLVQADNEPRHNGHDVGFFDALCPACQPIPVPA